MASRKKNSPKARRYTLKEKEDILRYVESVNAKQGRGGQTAAVKKYGISALTISTWLRGNGNGAVAHLNGNTKGVGGVIAKLAALHSEIIAKEKQLAAMQAEFAKLKASI
ncbi:hypothetical protein [Haloferula sp. BvORR071]|uniref:hypothetical protein n=1 Tax=Haloferula sp. BvORR071 TaxID=1396141 RepID=UPI00054ECE31|nr:hypothetical protein [Haloferula sp. BvORR071]